MQASHSSQAEELQAHLDRKCFVVLSETSSLQLYTYFTNEVKGYMQAWFHRTSLVPELNISAARKWAQCFLCRKFIFVFPPLFQRLHCEFVSTSSSDVFIQNKLPDSLFRKSPWQKEAMHCIVLWCNFQIWSNYPKLRLRCRKWKQFSPFKASDLPGIGEWD